MSENWPVHELEGLCTKIGSGSTPRGGSSVYLDKGEISLIRSQHVYNDAFKAEGIVYISEESAQKLKNVVVEKDDVLLNITGDSVARCCQVPDDVLPARVNQHVAIIRPDQTRLEPKYLRYFLVNPITQNHLLSLAGVGATRNALTKAMIQTLEILLPTLSEQKKIAHILGSLDDKIEVNRKMNETLEAMAQALFKSWFVDFDPVIDNNLIKKLSQNADDKELFEDIPEEFLTRAENQQLFEGIPEEFHPRTEKRLKLLKEKNDECSILNDELKSNSKLNIQNLELNPLFPSEFTPTDEMGYVPTGWKAGHLGDLTKAQGGYAFKSKDFTDVGYPVIKIKNIKNDGSVDIDDVQYFNDEITPKIEKFLLNDGDVIMAMTGATVAKSGVVVTKTTSALLNQRVARFLDKQDSLPAKWFSYLLVRREDKFAELVDMAQGSAQPNISSAGIESLATIIPNQEVLMHFDKIINDSFAKIIKNQKQQKTLTKLRDTLLPKLLSGNLSLDNISLEGVECH